jgi:hypothetical protein
MGESREDESALRHASVAVYSSADYALHPVNRYAGVAYEARHRVFDARKPARYAKGAHSAHARSSAARRCCCFTPPCASRALGADSLCVALLPASPFPSPPAPSLCLPEKSTVEKASLPPLQKRGTAGTCACIISQRAIDFPVPFYCCLLGTARC